MMQTFKEWESWYEAHAESADPIAADAVGAFGAEGTIWIVHKTW